MSEENRLAFEAALKVLSRRAVTEKQLTDKLYEKGFLAESVSYAVERAKEYRYVDDREYAKTFIEFNGKDKGGKRIKKELTDKGINAEIIAEALAGCDEEGLPLYDESEKAAEVLRKYLKGNIPESIKEKDKAYRYMVGRGFGYEVIAKAMTSVNSEE